MVNQELLNYIKTQLDEGESKENIKNALLENGWEDKDIEEAFSATMPATAPIPMMPTPVSAIPSPGLAPSMANAQSGVQPTTTEFYGVFALVGKTLVLYKQRFWALFGISLIPAVLGSILAIFKENPKLISSSYFVLIGILFVLVSIVVSMWGQVALLYAIKGSETGVMESYRLSRQKILSFWWVGILVTAVTVGGALLFIIPGIIFAVWLSLYECVGNGRC